MEESKDLKIRPNSRSVTGNFKLSYPSFVSNLTLRWSRTRKLLQKAKLRWRNCSFLKRENRELTSTIKTQDELLDEASQDQAQLRQNLQSARDKIKYLENQIERLEGELELPVPTPSQTGIETFLNAIWPEVSFLRDSILRLEMEYDLKLIMPRLRAIMERKERGRRVQSVPDWYEIHCIRYRSE